MKKAYIAIKYYEDFRNINTVNIITASLKSVGYESVCMIRDHEQGGLLKYDPEELMKKTFKEIDSCDLVIVDLNEKGVGLGIESGYAYAKDIPIITIARVEADISNTLAGISKFIIRYDIDDMLKRSLVRFIEEIKSERVTIGDCEWCNQHKKVQEIVSNDKDGQKVHLICEDCLDGDDAAILETLKSREANDDGTRFTHKEVMEILKESRDGGH